MACSGAEIAMSPNAKPGLPALEGVFGKDQRYEARITGEGGRLNLKWLLTGENPVHIEVLRRYLEIKGIDLNERDQMIDTLLDWVDPDNLVRLNGAEDEGGYKAANRMITNLEELKKVKGWEEFTSAKDWDADLTLSSTGAIDIAWASRDVLMALPGASEDRVDQYLAIRSGADEIDGTEDDPFTGIQAQGQAQALAVLGLQPQQLGDLVAAAPDNIRRVISVGKSGDATRTVRAVFVKGSNQLKSWKEF